MKKTGIFGGTFSPVHLGHLNAIKTFYDALGLDELIVVPCGIPPHKDVSALLPKEKRLEYLFLALEGENRNISVSTYELDKDETGYAVDTVLHFKEEKADSELYLLLGEDMLATLPDWRGADEIVKNAKIAFIKRSREENPLLSKALDTLLQKLGASVTEIGEAPVPISSSDIRNRFYGLESYLPEKVAEKIKRDRLDEIKREAEKRASGGRFGHVLSTEKEASRIAELCGLRKEDRERLSVASLLHDITKELSREKQIELMESLGERFSDEALKSEKTLHAESGAYLARSLFPYEADAKVFDAIFCHTTGKPGMTTLEKILFLADYTEETRRHESCVRLREYMNSLFEKGEEPERVLDLSVLFSLENTIGHLEETGAPIHKSSIEARDYYRKKT